MTKASRARLFLVVLAVLAVAVVKYCTPPSDDTLIAEFHARRADYDTLLTMFRADSGLGRVAYDFTRPANFFSGAPIPGRREASAQRLAAYRKLFTQLSLRGGIEGYDQKHIITFWRYGSGMGAGLGGTGKGLAFSDSLPPDTPAAFGCATPEDNCWRFRPIGSGWFVLNERSN
jgi:hypothetical protein